MKKMQFKRSGPGSAKINNLKKPFDFCCDIHHQDPKTQYNMRIPPFVSSLTNIAPNKDGPDLKFRIQDIGKPTNPTPRSGSYKMKNATNMGKSKQGHGPLRWYIEEEVALARDIIAQEKEMKYNRDRKARMIRKRAKSKRNKKRKDLTSINKENNTDDEKEGSDKDDDDKK